ncbi:MAG: hypothetical protein UV61_C0002G0058 [Candidatus Gottesmanbacteria bacterium GW2011_GWB1_43_11]|uniref:RDD domain-containing protein n=1 Tax=Candidatus Gottesmanbacteria bacterium GW2011_GWB1_43_11 TaxID=1618446 RepID=A0A0G1CPE3_9BACT|nr:MAG: hypothetical protein UV04_C0020G0015 [Candidatus Gottesmanbacteria bacterium GW2011_GWA2_42_16]KKS54128.1 MAG: hypothetical protein UV17_C0026G0015 [Candidatus Gottesmanbacteria bacterium GW2011_GWA1_42_26]KKS81856.1 MAG: hypothetical protein UV55_C0008G0071 [Candidatus Gottesmanbacteria bacterium GW2011_GWC1_43_10]KKS87337.1 MAG: hypothetical protein UV61_C0002G0058 [Candidatus Gottesmanbacteria bacterium GW2011_GWB1_43_11]HCM37508.1 hypothetical protein [Patescibacteria group bacteriu
MQILEFSIVWQVLSGLLTTVVGVGLLIFIRKRNQDKIKKSEPAGIWVRAICLGTDLAIIDILTSLLAFRGSLTSAGYIIILISLAYFFFFWLFFGATPAMMLVRIKIISQDEKPLKVWQILVRFCMFAFLMIGWVTILFDKKDKRALHDFVAKTKVEYVEKFEKNSIPKIQLGMFGLVGFFLMTLIIHGFGEKLTKYVESNQVTFVDLNQDTLIDGLAIDADEDGKADVFKYDLNNDRVVEFTTMDADSDGVAESIDLNNDGRIDGFDFDRDNKVDILVIKGQFFIWLWRIWFGLLFSGLVGMLVFSILQENKLIPSKKITAVKNKQ